MLDINGHELGVGDYAQLLVRVEEISDEGIRVRIANSEMELRVGFKNDEALGGLVADSELIFLASAAEIQTPASAPSESAVVDSTGETTGSADRTEVEAQKC